MESAGELLEAGVNALARSDAAELEGLVAAAQSAKIPGTPQEREAALAGLRTLGYLLRLTRQNLRILRAAKGVSRGYGTERS